MLEAEALSGARNFEQWRVNREEDDHERFYALSRSREFAVLAGRFGEAWVIYESVMGRPTAEIVLEMCEAGFTDHARFIVTSK